MLKLKHPTNRSVRVRGIDLGTTNSSVAAITWDLQQDSAPKGAERARLLFVGISRATQWVYLSTLQHKQFTEYAQLKTAAEQNNLSIQYGNERDLFGDMQTVTEEEEEFLVL